MGRPFAEAKGRLAEPLQRTLDEGPQRVVREGEDAVVVPKSQYEFMRLRKPTFVEHLLAMPEGDDDLVGLIRRDDRAVGNDAA